MSDYSGMRSRIKLRGSMLVAWFADATPPVLWRWSTSDVTAGFGLRNQDGRVELLKHEPGVGSSVVAVFANEDRAAAALERLSRVLLDQKPSRAAYGARGLVIPRWLSITLGIVLALFLLGWLALHLFMQWIAGPMAALDNTQAMPAQAQVQQQRPAPYSGSIIPGLPSTNLANPAPPSTPPLGTPVDVDSFYKK